MKQFIIEKIRQKGLRIFIWIEKLSFIKLVSYFIVIVAFFGGFYCYLTPGEHGIYTTSPEEFDYLKAVYFSIVTISSLGFGDMHPLGFSRFLAVIEVLIGLSLMGMLVAKLTSHRLTYHVKRLYINDSHNQLSPYIEKFRLANSKFNLLIQTQSSFLTSTPSVNKPKQKKSKEKLEQFQQSLKSYFSDIVDLLASLKSYINVESKNGDFFSEISIDITREIGDVLTELANSTTQFFIGIAEDDRRILLTGDTGKRYKEILSETQQLCSIVLSNCENTNLKLFFSTIDDKCKKTDKDIMIVSVPIFDFNPPDQLISGSTDPA